MYVYSIQQITGAGYECDEIGIFNTLASAMKEADALLGGDGS